MKYVFKHWRTAKLVAIYKREDRASPTSNRPIGFSSHVRKAIESAVARAIPKTYTFNRALLGLQTGTGTETAIARHITNSD